MDTETSYAVNLNSPQKVYNCLQLHYCTFWHVHTSTHASDRNNKRGYWENTFVMACTFCYILDVSQFCHGPSVVPLSLRMGVKL